MTLQTNKRTALRSHHKVLHSAVLFSCTGNKKRGNLISKLPSKGNDIVGKRLGE